MSESQPTVGETVIYDGDPHRIVAIAGRTVDFATENGPTISVGAQNLVAVDGGWAVRGRETKRPPRATVGVQATPAKEG